MTQVKNIGDVLKVLSSKSWMFYAVALLCFLLPFGNISCSGAPDKTIAKASGIQIILDDVTIIDSKPSKSDSDKENFPFEIRVLTLFTALALIVGIVCLRLGGGSNAIACGAGVGTIICLIVGLLVMRDAAAEGGFIISPAYGWWFTLFLSLVGSAGALFQFLIARGFIHQEPEQQCE